MCYTGKDRGLREKNELQKKKKKNKQKAKDNK